MAEEVTKDEVKEEVTESVAENSDWKSHPLTHKLTSQLNELKQAEAARKEAEATARKEAETKKAEEEGRYNDLIKMRDEEIEALKTKHATDLLQRELKTEMVRAGFTNDMFLDGAVSRYDKEQTVPEYVQSLLNDESNKLFLTNKDARNVPSPPDKATVSGANKLTPERVKAYENSDDPEQRKQARDYLKAYFDKHRKMPE